MKKKNIFAHRIKPLVRSKILILFFAFCLLSRFSFAIEYIWVRPYEIKFNYEAGQNNDALTIRKADGSEATIPEWKYSTRSDNFAYIKSQTSRKIQVRFDSNCTTTMHLVINLNVASGTGIGEVCNLFVANYTRLDWITITLDGTIPGTVDTRNFTWQWDVYALPMDIVNYCAAESNNSTSHTYYTLLAAPQAPMEEPWTSVLDYACEWASGQANAASIAQKVTEGIYYMGDTDEDIDYDWPLGRCMYSSGTGNRVFNLTDYLSDINSLSGVIVNCSDVGNLFNIFSAAVGLTSSNKIIWRSSYPYYFDINLIDPIDSPGWNTTTWGYHQYGWFNSSVDDACLRVNYSSPILPTNMVQGTYDYYLIGGYSYDSFDIGTTSVY